MLMVLQNYDSVYILTLIHSCLDLFSLNFTPCGNKKWSKVTIFVAMKRFKLHTSIIIVAAIVVFALNCYYLATLYLSISEDVNREVLSAMVDTDIDDLWERATECSRLHDGERTISGRLNLGSDTVVMSVTEEEGKERIVNHLRFMKTESFGNQMMAEMSEQMHGQMDSILPINLRKTDSIFRYHLAERGLRPEFVAVELVDSAGKTIIENHRITDTENFDVFELPYGPGGRYFYRAYVTPLVRHILKQMSGVILTTLLMIVIFIVGFRYLLVTVAKLRTIEEMKDDFTGNMTHELKTPIAIAYSANDALLNFDYANDPGKKEAYLKIALKQLDKLSELVESILAVSMERRNMKLSVRRMDILPIIREVAEVQQMRGEKEIRIRVETSEKEIIAEVDKSHLTNVLNNLVDNAIKYSGDEVEIVISCDRGRIVVSDNGIGIPSKNLPYIFDKFYRVPHGNRQDIRGYGIGLYYVRQTIEQMGGTISVESTSGKGSRFTITLN